MSDPWMAEISRQHLDKLVVWGKAMNVRISKHNNVSMPRDDPAGQSGLTKDYTNSPLHRYKKVGHSAISMALKLTFENQSTVAPDKLLLRNARYSIQAGSKNCSNIFKPGQTLHLSNIGEGVGQEDLIAAFREYGTVHQFKVCACFSGG